MKIFGLVPEASRGSEPSRGSQAPGLSHSLLFGSTSFGAVSLAAYSIWAFQLVPGTVGLYATTAAVYIGFSGVALSRLVRAPGAWKRFPFFFALVFVVYAAGWCVFWFGLEGKFHADFWGAAAGLAAMTWLFQRAFGKRGDFLPLFAVLFTLHSLGYYLGDELHAAIRGTTGRLLWGAAHGLGFGAGLGYVLFRCQEPPSTQPVAK
jgi:hypothetical protein